MPQKCMECFRLLFDPLAWIAYQSLSGIRDSRKAESLWGVFRGVRRSKEVNTPQLIGQMVRGYYVEVLREFRKRPALLKSGKWHFHQDNTPVHNFKLSQTIWLRWASRQFLSLPIVETLLAPCDFCLFPKLRGCRYETIEEMKEAVMKVIDTLTQEDFHGAFQKLLEWYKCIAAGGDYFESGTRVSCVHCQ